MSNLDAQNAHVNSRTKKSNKSSKRRKKKGDYTRRGRWLDHIADNTTAKLSKGALSVATAISRRGGATLSDIYDKQTELAKIARCAPSTFREKIEELVQAGYLKVERSEPERDRSGQWFRRLYNRLKFVVPPRPKSTKQGKSCSDLGTESGALKQLTTFVGKKVEQVRTDYSLLAEKAAEHQDLPDVKPEDFAALRATWRSSKAKRGLATA